MASLIASFSVRLPLVTARTSAPSNFMRKTLRDWRGGHRAPVSQCLPHEIERQAPDVLLAHVHDAFETQHSADGRSGNAMLPSACFSNNAPFAHTFCQ